MDQHEMISNMLDDILADNNVDAQEKFNALIAQRTGEALNARKTEIAPVIYPKEPNEDATQAQS